MDKIDYVKIFAKVATSCAYICRESGAGCGNMALVNSNLPSAIRLQFHQVGRDDVWIDSNMDRLVVEVISFVRRKGAVAHVFKESELGFIFPGVMNFDHLAKSFG